MKRFQSDLVMNETGWPIDKTVKQETDLQNDSTVRYAGLKQHLFSYQNPTSMTLPTRVRPYV